MGSAALAAAGPRGPGSSPAGARDAPPAQLPQGTKLLLKRLRREVGGTPELPQRILPARRRVQHLRRILHDIVTDVHLRQLSRPPAYRGLGLPVPSPGDLRAIVSEQVQ